MRTFIMASLFALIVAALFWGQYRTVQTMLAMVRPPLAAAWDYFTPQPWPPIRGI